MLGKDAPNTSFFLKAQKKLWETTAFHGNNMAESSGWVRSIQKEPFSAKEIDEFLDNIYLKLKNPYLDSGNCSFLEIGAGSGLLLNKLIPYVKSYDAADISEVILEKCRQYMNSTGKEVNFHCLYAHEIDKLQGKKYNVIIINSVMQYFVDYDYAKSVLSKCRLLLDDKGIVFCGDVIDADKRDEIIQYMLQRNKNSNRTKDLFYYKAFFTDLMDLAGFSKCDISDKIFTIPNELSSFRYDVILHH